MANSVVSTKFRILAASDLSEESDAALRAAAALARVSGGELLVVHCMQPPVFPYWEGSISPSIQTDWERNALTDLEWQVRRVLGEEPPPFSLEVRLGDPASEVSACATDRGTDLVVLGPHQPRLAFDDLLGTTADRIIRLCEVPCLVANRPLSPPFRRVLFPVDFSAPSNHCVTRGIELLGPTLMCRGGGDSPPAVVELLFVSAFAASQPRLFAVEPKLGELVERARAVLPEGSGIKLLPRILSAPLPVEGIRRAAESMDAELVVMGTHGYGMLGRTLIGSVASSTVRTLPRSILMVPPP
jgi:nucleotide-binding universal stress UspA family protein